MRIKGFTGHNTLRLTNLSLMVFVVASTLVGGCRKKHDAPAAHDSTLVAPAPGPMTLAIRLLHTDSTLADSVHPFTTKDTVHAVIHTENASDSSRVHATWRYLDRKVAIAENESELGAGANDTHFDLMNANPWPVGIYQLFVMVDGHLRDSISFPIVAKKRP